MGEPSLSQVHADLVERFEHDKRLRAVEQEMAEARAVIRDLPRMEARIMGAITSVAEEVRRVDTEASTPKPWPAIVSAIVAAVALLLIVAERLYGA